MGPNPFTLVATVVMRCYAVEHMCMCLRADRESLTAMRRAVGTCTLVVCCGASLNGVTMVLCNLLYGIHSSKNGKGGKRNHGCAQP